MGSAMHSGRTACIPATLRPSANLRQPAKQALAGQQLPAHLQLLQRAARCLFVLRNLLLQARNALGQHLGGWDWKGDKRKM